jgi:Gpi18-like mannosyltransferase
MEKTTQNKFLISIKYRLNKLLKYSQLPVYRYLFIGIIFSILIRLICIPNQSSDYKSFLLPWYDFIVSHGGFAAFKYNFADYTPAYLYWIFIASTLLSGLPKILAIKLFAMMVDFLCAFFTYKIVKLQYPNSNKPIFAFLAVIFSPTVIYNSAIWGQCDVIYTTGLIACIYFLSIRKQIYALTSFGIAISFKLQALFLAPFLLIIFSKKRISWFYLPLIPLVYLATILPAWIAGRPLKELFLVYFEQSHKYKELAKNVPNLYQWIPNDFYTIAVPIGLSITMIAMLTLAYTVYKSKLELTQERLIYLATISVFFMPYLLPKMHERYFYPTDILSIIFAFHFPRYYWVPIIVQISSLLSYLGTPSHIKICSLALGFTLWFVIKNCDFIYPKSKLTP